MNVLEALDAYLAEIGPQTGRGRALAALATSLAVSLTECEPKTAPAMARELRVTLAELAAVEAHADDDADAWVVGLPSALRHTA